MWACHEALPPARLVDPRRRLRRARLHRYARRRARPADRRSASRGLEGRRPVGRRAHLQGRAGLAVAGEPAHHHLAQRAHAPPRRPGHRLRQGFSRRSRHHQQRQDRRQLRRVRILRAAAGRQPRLRHHAVLDSAVQVLVDRSRHGRAVAGVRGPAVHVVGRRLRHSRPHRQLHRAQRRQSATGIRVARLHSHGGRRRAGGLCAHQVGGLDAGACAARARAAGQRHAHRHSAKMGRRRVRRRLGLQLCQRALRPQQLQRPRLLQHALHLDLLRHGGPARHLLRRRSVETRRSACACPR